MRIILLYSFFVCTLFLLCRQNIVFDLPLTSLTSHTGNVSLTSTDLDKPKPDLSVPYIQPWFVSSIQPSSIRPWYARHIWPWYAKPWYPSDSDMPDPDSDPVPDMPDPDSDPVPDMPDPDSDPVPSDPDPDSPSDSEPDPDSDHPSDPDPDSPSDSEPDPTQTLICQFQLHPTLTLCLICQIRIKRSLCQSWMIQKAMSNYADIYTSRCNSLSYDFFRFVLVTVCSESRNNIW